MRSRRFRSIGVPVSVRGLFGARPSRRLALLLLVFWAASSSGTSVDAQEAIQPLPLPALEARIPEAPGVLADESAIDEAIEGIRAARDKSGLAYTYENSFGPAALIVIDRTDNFVLRYEQLAGLSLPLEGTKISQQLTVLSAQEREQLAIIALEESRRLRLGQLRNAYVQYWSYLNQVGVAQNYLDQARDERNQAKTLRQTGFWTATDLLDFLTSVQRVQSDESTFHSSAGAQLALIESAVGGSVPSFQPVAPAFFQDCKPDRARTLESAYSVDAQLAEYDANAVLVEEQLARIRGATIDARARAQIGSVTDLNHQVSGYSLNGGVEVSLPTHARDEERALRAQYEAQLKTLALREAQRRVEISSSVNSILDDIDGLRTTLQQARQDESTSEADLRIALVRFNLLRQTSDVGFKDVSEKRNAAYVAERGVAVADASLLLKANDLLTIAPGACGAPYAPMPLWTQAPTAQATATPAPGASPTPQASPHAKHPFLGL